MNYFYLVIPNMWRGSLSHFQNNIQRIFRQRTSLHLFCYFFVFDNTLFFRVRNIDKDSDFFYCFNWIRNLISDKFSCDCINIKKIPNVKYINCLINFVIFTSKTFGEFQMYLSTYFFFKKWYRVCVLNEWILTHASKNIFVIFLCGLCNF